MKTVVFCGTILMLQNTGTIFAMHETPLRQDPQQKMFIFPHNVDYLADPELMTLAAPITGCFSGTGRREIL